MISGQEEGAFAFLSLNFLLNKLQSTVAAADTVAAIDLGGASTQVSFYTTAANLPTNVAYTISLAGVQNYNTYTYSFLGYGNDQARLAAIAASPLAGSTITFPCFHAGYSVASTTNSSQTVAGSSNIANCQNIITQIMKYDKCGASTDCSIDGVFMPTIPANMEVYAFSAVATAGTFFNSTGSITVGDLKTRVEAFCARPWSDISANYRVDAFLPLNCFLGMYTVELLNKGYRLGLTRTIKVQSAANGISLSWALGSTLYDVSTIPCKAGIEACKSSANTFAMVSPLVMMLMFLAALLFV